MTNEIDPQQYIYVRSNVTVCARTVVAGERGNVGTLPSINDWLLCGQNATANFIYKQRPGACKGLIDDSCIFTSSCHEIVLPSVSTGWTDDDILYCGNMMELGILIENDKDDNYQLWCYFNLLNRKFCAALGDSSTIPPPRESLQCSFLQRKAIDIPIQQQLDPTSSISIDAKTLLFLKPGPCARSFDLSRNWLDGLYQEFNIYEGLPSNVIQSINLATIEQSPQFIHEIHEETQNDTPVQKNECVLSGDYWKALDDENGHDHDDRGGGKSHGVTFLMHFALCRGRPDCPFNSGAFCKEEQQQHGSGYDAVTLFDSVAKLVQRHVPAAMYQLQGSQICYALDLCGVCEQGCIDATNTETYQLVLLEGCQFDADAIRFAVLSDYTNREETFPPILPLSPSSTFSTILRTHDQNPTADVAPAPTPLEASRESYNENMQESNPRQHNQPKHYSQMTAYLAVGISLILLFAVVGVLSRRSRRSYRASSIVYEGVELAPIT